MKHKIILLFVLQIMILSLYAQTDQLNRFDLQGKKHGKWIVYLDKNWKKPDDNTKTVYCRHTYYDHGTNLYPMGGARKGWKLESKALKPGDSTVHLLDGEYTWYDKKGRRRSTHILQNGEYISCKEYSKGGALEQHFDYTYKCPLQPYGWRVSIYDPKGVIKVTIDFCPHNGQWPYTRG
jgi:hypothetical protein